MLKQSLNFKLLQKLSPQQIQLMKLIQLPTQAFEERLKQEIEEKSLKRRLPEISTPTLLIWGKEDPLFPLNVASIFKREIKNSKLVILENTVHCPQYDQPKKTAKIHKEFLDDV